MNEPKFTRGKWYWNKREKLVQAKLKDDPMICEIDYVGQDSEEEEANAHLIAAAPDMYKALEHILDRAGSIELDATSVRKILSALRKARCETETKTEKG